MRIETNNTAMHRHNEAAVILGSALMSMPEGIGLNSDEKEALRWLVIESLCIIVGLEHNLCDRHIAEKAEKIAERLATGERIIDRSKL